MVDLGKHGVNRKQSPGKPLARGKATAETGATKAPAYRDPSTGRLARPSGLKEVITRAAKLLGSDAIALEWLKKPSRWLDDLSPLDMIKAGNRKSVEAYLEQIECGVYV